MLACADCMTDIQSVPSLSLPHHHPRPLHGLVLPLCTSLCKPEPLGQLSSPQQVRLVLSQGLYTCPSLCLSKRLCLAEFLSLHLSSNVAFSWGLPIRKTASPITLYHIITFLSCRNEHSLKLCHLFPCSIREEPCLSCPQCFPIMLTSAWHMEEAW